MLLYNDFSNKLKNMIRLIKFLIILVILIILVLGYLGFVPVVSNLFGSNKPRDLGVVYAEADIMNVGSKLGVVYEKSGTGVSDSLVLEGQKSFVGDLTDEEMTALISQHSKSWKYYPFKNVQVKFNPDGTAEASGTLLVDRLEGYIKEAGFDSNPSYQKGLNYVRKVTKYTSNPAFYIKGKVDVTNSSYSGGIDELVIGKLPIPTNKLTNDRDMMTLAKDLLSVVGVSIKDVHFSDGKLSVDAQIPQTIKLLSE